MAHHYRDDANFGVSTGFWDRVFGTGASAPRGFSADPAERIAAEVHCDTGLPV